MRIAVALLGLALVACGDDDSGSGTQDGGGTGDGSSNGDGGGPTATYHLIDLAAAGCSDHVIAEMVFDKQALSGSFVPRSCAPGAPSGAASSFEYHARFPAYVVADGHVLVEASESEAPMGMAPVAYCREDPAQSMIEFLRFVLSTDVTAADCDIDHEYRDPVDGYYNGGAGGTTCSSMSYMRSGTQLVWIGGDRIGADIALDMGSATAGHPGVATVKLVHSSGATLTPSVTCWAN